jgi:hypothetical protein
MNSRTVFSRYLWFLALTIILSSFILPRRYKMPYPQTLGPQFTPQVKRDYIDAISVNQPELVLVGDSLLYLGVDPQILSGQLGIESYSFGIPGSGSAAWYLLLKNVILATSYRPKYIVILFRDTMLTAPSVRTTGRYFAQLDDFAGRREPLVSELAFINLMSPIEKFAEQYFPLYSARWNLRAGFDERIRYTAPSVLLNCQMECADEAINSVFGKQRMDVVAVNQAAEDAGRILYTPAMMDFDKQIDRSFLPAMIELAKENELVLVLVHAKTKQFPPNASEPRALIRYMKSLETYLSGQDGVYYMDFAHDPRILDSYFFDDLHFNAEGREAFTKMLAEQLQSILKK